MQTNSSVSISHQVMITIRKAKYRCSGIVLAKWLSIESWPPWEKCPSQLSHIAHISCRLWRLCFSPLLQSWARIHHHLHRYRSIGENKCQWYACRLTVSDGQSYRRLSGKHANCSTFRQRTADRVLPFEFVLCFIWLFRLLNHRKKIDARID